METKYYAPQQELDCLTLATHPGTLTEEDVQENIMRMIVMDEQEIPDAEEAMEEIQKMTREERKKLWKVAVQEYYEPEMLDCLNRKHILPSPGNEERLKLVPITEAMKYEDETPTEEEAIEAMWETLNEFSLKTYKECVVKITEWD